MKKNNKSLKYLLGPNKIIKEAAPPPIKLPPAPGRFSRFMQYMRPKAVNPFAAGPVGQTPHMGALLAELKRLSAPNLNWEDASLTPNQVHARMSSFGQKYGLKFDTNPTSPTYRQILDFDPANVPNEIKNPAPNSGFTPEQSRDLLIQEVLQYNEYIRAQAKGWGSKTPGRGYNLDVSTPLGRGSLVNLTTDRAILGAKILSGLTAVYMLYAGVKSLSAPSTKNKQKRQIVDEVLESQDLESIPKTENISSSIASLNSTLEQLMARHPVLQNKLEPYVSEGEGVLNALEDLNSSSLDLDDASSVSSYGSKVAFANSEFKLYINNLRKLSQKMTQGKKNNIARQINAVINDLSEHVRFIESQRAQ